MCVAYNIHLPTLLPRLSPLVPPRHDQYNGLPSKNAIYNVMLLRTKAFQSKLYNVLTGSIKFSALLGCHFATALYRVPGVQTPPIILDFCRKLDRERGNHQLFTQFEANIANCRTGWYLTYSSIPTEWSISRYLGRGDKHANRQPCEPCVGLFWTVSKKYNYKYKYK